MTCIQKVWTFAPWGLLVLVMLPGCGSGESWKSKTYSASGTISINGSAPENAILMLYSNGAPVDERNSQPWAIVKPDGTFSMTTYENLDGAPEGNYKVALYWPKDNTGMGDRLNGVYAIPDKPFMTVSITRGKNVLPPIELTNVEVAPASPQQSAFVLPSE